MKEINFNTANKYQDHNYQSVLKKLSLIIQLKEIFNTQEQDIDRLLDSISKNN